MVWVFIYAVLLYVAALGVGTAVLGRREERDQRRELTAIVNHYIAAKIEEGRQP